MNSTIKNVATAYLGPKILKRFTWQYVALGIAAYYGLKLLSRKGILPHQTGKAVDLIDQGIDFAKEQIGIKPAARSPQNHLPTETPELH